MMLIGCDVVNIARIEGLLQKWGDVFVRRILSELELELFAKKHPSLKASFLAKRFAAKEAISKALGTGIKEISFSQISVLNNSAGAPYVSTPELPYTFSISLADDEPVAIAFVMAMSAIP